MSDFEMPEDFQPQMSVPQFGRVGWSPDYKSRPPETALMKINPATTQALLRSSWAFVQARVVTAFQEGEVGGSRREEIDKALDLLQGLFVEIGAFGK